MSADFLPAPTQKQVYDRLKAEAATHDDVHFAESMDKEADFLNLGISIERSQYVQTLESPYEVGSLLTKDWF